MATSHDPRVFFSTTAEFSYHREKYTLVLNAGHIFKYIFLLLHFLLKIERVKKEKSAAMQLHQVDTWPGKMQDRRDPVTTAYISFYKGHRFIILSEEYNSCPIWVNIISIRW